MSSSLSLSLFLLHTYLSCTWNCNEKQLNVAFIICTLCNVYQGRTGWKVCVKAVIIFQWFMSRHVKADEFGSWSMSFVNVCVLQWFVKRGKNCFHVDRTGYENECRENFPNWKNEWNLSFRVIHSRYFLIKSRAALFTSDQTLSFTTWTLQKYYR